MTANAAAAVVGALGIGGSVDRCVFCPSQRTAATFDANGMQMHPQRLHKTHKSRQSSNLSRRREYQFKTPQWTMGKNFDDTGAFGPDLVTADELPPAARGLRIETRLNGEVVQSASTDQLIFDVETLISTLSEAVTLEVGDVIVTGTPSGIGHARNPKLYMKAGDVCEVEVEGIGVLRNEIVDEVRGRAEAA